MTKPKRNETIRDARKEGGFRMDFGQRMLDRLPTEKANQITAEGSPENPPRFINTASFTYIS